jgi:hypothetical protein
MDKRLQPLESGAEPACLKRLREKTGIHREREGHEFHSCR